MFSIVEWKIQRWRCPFIQYSWVLKEFLNCLFWLNCGYWWCAVRGFCSKGLIGSTLNWHWYNIRSWNSFFYLLRKEFFQPHQWQTNKNNDYANGSKDPIFPEIEIHSRRKSDLSFRVTQNCTYDQVNLL